VTARRRPRAARRGAPSTKRTAAPAVTAEALLLDLARTLTARTSQLARASDVQAIIDASAAPYAPDRPLAAALRQDWLRRRDDKTARLALGWAREQVRLALVEILQRARAARLMRADGDAETLAWLWLAACEALAHEPATAVPDRVHALTAFLTAG
jgi:hypothetical protein